jgi:hypothetical protein
LRVVLRGRFVGRFEGRFVGSFCRVVLRVVLRGRFWFLARLRSRGDLRINCKQLI